jgi:hypothetical protein
MVDHLTWLAARMKSRPSFRGGLADRVPGTPPPEHYAGFGFLIFGGSRRSVCWGRQKFFTADKNGMGADARRFLCMTAARVNVVAGFFLHSNVCNYSGDCWFRCTGASTICVNLRASRSYPR